MLSTPRKLQVLVSFAVLLGFAAAVGCNGFFVDPVLTAINVGPAGQQILVGNKLQMQALGTYDQGGVPKDITGKVLWGSGDQIVATVSKSGLVTGVSMGSATITATSGTVQGSASVQVAQAVTSIAVTPSSQTVSASSGTPFCLQAIAQPGSVDISSTATWAFADPSNAAETGINKTTTTTCTGQAFSIGTLSPTPAPTTLSATASAPGSGGGTVTSPKVAVGVTQ